MMRNRFCCALLLLVAGCSAGWNPIPLQEVEFLERSQTQEEDGVRVTAAVPSAREARSVFGVDLYGRGVQPVWIDIENNSESLVSFLPHGLDADYFTPLETASMHPGNKQRNDMERYFFSNTISVVIDVGERRQGFVFTHLDEGTKSFNVDIIPNDSDEGLHFTFFIPVPGLKVDHYEVDFDSLYAESEIRRRDRGGTST